MAFMRWNPFRPGARPEAGTTDPGSPGKPPTDKLTMAIRQRRMFTAQQRVDQLLGFGKLGRRWCEYPTADQLDARRSELGADPAVQEWPDGPALGAALRAASALLAGESGFAHVLDEPEARWLEAPLHDLLVATADALAGLREGVVLCSDAGVLLIEVKVDGEGRHSFATASAGDWPLRRP